jgi:hypothetical protein
VWTEYEQAQEYPLHLLPKTFFIYFISIFPSFSIL